MLFYLSLSVLILSLGAQIILRSFWHNRNKLIFKYVFIISIILIFSILSYNSLLQYFAWLQGEISKFFLPPYQNVSYFIFYVGARFFASYLISLIAAFLFIYAAKHYNQKYEERFFYPEEYWLGGTSIFLAGYPGTLFYIVSILAIAVVLSLIVSRWSLSGERLSLYYFWTPVAIFTILIMEFWFKNLPWWSLLKI